MALLTDLLVASPIDANDIFSRYPQSKEWPALELKGMDNIKLAALLRALDEDQDALALEGEECIAASASGGPWVFVLPDTFVVRLATHRSDETNSIASSWAEDEELAFDGWTAEDVAPAVNLLRSHAQLAMESNKSLILWMSL